MRSFWPALTALLLAAPAYATPTPSVRYLALGDSFTIGTGSSRDQSFPERLAMRWRARCDVSVLNPATNGFTTDDVLSVEIPGIREFDPTIVTLAIGANDLVRGRSVDVYRARLGAIFQALGAVGVPATRVVGLPQPDWSRSPAAAAFGDPAALHAGIVAFNTVLREEVVRRGGRWVDLFPLMTQQATDHRIASDGLHPSAEAYDAWAGALEGALGEVCPGKR